MRTITYSDMMDLAQLAALVEAQASITRVIAGETETVRLRSFVSGDGTEIRGSVPLTETCVEVVDEQMGSALMSALPLARRIGADQWRVSYAA